MSKTMTILVVLRIAACVRAQTVVVPNPSFESGTDKPEGWSLSDKGGAWENAGHTGKRCVSVTGTGSTSNYWSTTGVKLDPGKTYRVAFWVKGEETSGGCVITGPSFCSRDYSATDKWARYSFVFVVPKDLRGAYLRFGQWMVKGKVLFDDISLQEVTPVYCTEGGLSLGEGESVDGSHYKSESPLGGEGTNFARTLADFSCGFNSNRWVFGGDNSVVYRYQIGDRAQASAKVAVSVGYYQSGKCVVEVSSNGRDFVSVGEIQKMELPTLTLPGSLFPTSQVYVRLRSENARGREGDSAPGSFQVHNLSYEAELDRPASQLEGNTRYLEVARQSDVLTVRIESLGPLRPAPASRARIEIANQEATARTVKASLQLGTQVFSRSTKVEGRGKFPVEIPYELMETGELPLVLSVSEAGKEVYHATSSFTVPQLYAGNYGYRLTGAPATLGLWWCEATYKVSRERSVPKATRSEVSISAARNEYEPFQLVLHPNHRLETATVEVSDLLGPGGQRIDSENVQIDRVEYVKVTHPTDSEGVAGWWPDPLPHYRGATSVLPDQNQPLWFTVYVPESAAAGNYAGTITVSTPGASSKVPLKLHVWNFTLPRESHLRSGFGVSSANVQRYHNLSTPDEVKQVMEKYSRNFAAHRICPYTPMRPIKVQFSGRNWVGGEVVLDERHEGAQSLKIVDQNEKGVVFADYGSKVPVEVGLPYRLVWWCKAAAGQRYLLTVGQHDADGNWRPGHNRDHTRDGSGEWKREEAEIRFDEGTRFANVTLRPAVWTEDGRFTGSAWFDEVSFSRVQDGKNLLTDSGFEAKAADIKVQHDFTEFDEDAHHFLDELGYNSFALPVMGLGSGTFYERTSGELAGSKAGTLEYETVFAEYLKPIEEHLKQKGWLNKAYVYWFDEPSPQDYDFVGEGMKTLAKAAPGICKFLTVKPVKELFGNVDLWCIPVGVFSPEEAKSRQQQGEEIWWYLCCGPHSPWVGLFIDHPAIDFRMWSWMSWKWNVQGLLIWETTYWTSSAAYPREPQNPWEDPMSYVSGYGTLPGTKSFWGNGDGRLFYPPNRDVLKDRTKYLEGPVNSIRAELMREGIEDFEYFYLLKQLLEKSRSRAAAEAAKLLEIPASIIEDPTHFTKDPQPLHAHREKLARAIEQLR
ncbi:MAG: DUF4091 domain-containing protein [Armatimonadetes bacterium]|nr:DUF4091 domain-containing protein [Armatimonadota bacterium]